MCSCVAKKHFNNTVPKVFHYPCKIKEPDPDVHVCREINLASLEKQRKEERERQKVKKPPCLESKPRPKKRFLELLEKGNGALPYCRKWNVEEDPCSDWGGLPKWFRRQKKADDFCVVCPRELDEYEKKLWVPICKKKKEEQPEEIEDVDPTLCVFCLGCLYTGGFLHELHERVPLIKEQSKIYGDEIAGRIGIRTRVIVHRNCYRAYIDYVARQQENKDLFEEETEEDEDSDFCGEGKEESEDEIIEDAPPVKPYFCLKKYQPPPLPSVDSPPALGIVGGRRNARGRARYLEDDDLGSLRVEVLDCFSYPATLTDVRVKKKRKRITLA